jgi:hypothetical protein
MEVVDKATYALEHSQFAFSFLSVASWQCLGQFKRVWQFAIRVSPNSYARVAVYEEHVEELCGCKLRQVCLPGKVFCLSPSIAVKLINEWDIGTHSLSDRILRGVQRQSSNPNLDDCSSTVHPCVHHFFHHPPMINGRRCTLFCCSSCTSGNSPIPMRTPESFCSS